jgi:pimeloyl-ACP methyl ester carboxylesterase
MSTGQIANADTIVLIHGLWMTPRCWEHWIPRYERRGYRVIAPAYPGFEGEVEALRADPTPIERVTVPDTVEHLAGIVSELESPPILIGHSFGGALVQILLDRGLGAAGIAIDSVPTEGVRTRPATQIKATFPVLHNPANRHRAVAFTPRQFHYAFTNTLSEQDSAAVYERYHIPAPGRWVWDGVLANVTRGHQATWVNYRNDERAPLLFLAGGKDHIMPAAVNKENAQRYETSAAHTDYYEFADRDHYTIGAPDWEKVADYARTWATEHAPWSRRVIARRRSMES